MALVKIIDQMDSPFKFLDFYTREDRAIFFGRDREIDELYHRVFESKILLVYGISGTGKSSLIHCGLANKFQESDWFPLHVRRGKNILESLFSSMRDFAQTPLKQADLTSSAFLKSLRSLYLDYYKPIHFIFDQFEELFIFGSTSEKTEFIEVIKSLSESDIHCRFIFVMREEYLAGMTEFEKYIPHFLSNRVRIEKMSPVNAKLAVEGPCKVFNIKVERGFAEKLVNRLTNADSEIELTYLQVFLDKLYRLAKADAVDGIIELKIGLLQKTENIIDVLGSFLEEQIEQLPDPNLAISVLKSFISIKGTRRQMTLKEVKNFLFTIGRPIDEEDIKPLVQKLIQLRILRDKDQNNRYELRHDALAAVINKKISVLERDIIEIRHFLENGYLIYEKRGKLLAKEDLKYIAPYEEKLFLGQEIKEFVAKSKHELSKSKRRLRNYQITLVVSVIAILSAFALWAFTEKNKANYLYIKSKASNFNYLSKQVVDQNPNNALRLAEYAFMLDSSNYDIKSNIKQIYYNNSFYLKKKLPVEGYQINAISEDGSSLLISSENSVYLTDMEGNKLQSFRGHRGEIIAAVFSPDGKFILTGSYDKTARLWDMNGNTIKILHHRGEVGHVTFSADGKLLLTSSWDNISNLWDLSGRLINTFPDNFLTAISPDGHLLLGHKDRTSFVCDLNGKILQIFEGHTDIITTLAFSPDGKTILSGSRDMTLRLYSIDGQLQTVFHDHSSAISSAVFSADGNRITSSCKSNVLVWHKNGNLQRNFKLYEEAYLISLNDEIEVIYVISRDGFHYVLYNSGNLISMLEGLNDQVRFIRFSTDGRLILAGSLSEVGIWDNKGRLIQFLKSSLSGSATQIISGDFLGNNRLVILTSDNNIRIWDLNGKLVQQWLAQPASKLAVSPCSKLIITNDFNNSARLYDLEGNLLTTFIGHRGQVISVSFSQNSDMVLTGSMDHTAKLWNIDGNLLATLHGHTGPVNKVDFVKNDRLVYTGSYAFTETFAEFRGDTRLLGAYAAADNSVRMWDLNGNQLGINRFFAGNFRTVGFCPNGEFYLAGFDNQATLFNHNGFEMQTIKDDIGAINAVAISPDGRTLVTASSNIYLRNNMISYWFFHDYYQYQQLSLADKLKYGMTKFEEIKKETDDEVLIEAAKYYFESADHAGQDNRMAYLFRALELNQELFNRTKRPKYIYCMIEISLLINESHQTANLRTSIESYVDVLLASNNPYELSKSGHFFVELAEKTYDDRLKRIYLDYALDFYTMISPDFIEENLSDKMAQVYLKIAILSLATGDYADAVECSKRGLDIQTTLPMQACHVLALLINDQLDEAGMAFQSFNSDIIQGVRIRQEAQNQLKEVEKAGNHSINYDYLKIRIDELN